MDVARSAQNRSEKSQRRAPRLRFRSFLCRISLSGFVQRFVCLYRPSRSGWRSVAGYTLSFPCSTLETHGLRGATSVPAAKKEDWKQNFPTCDSMQSLGTRRRAGVPHCGPLPPVRGLLGGVRGANHIQLHTKSAGDTGA